MKHPEGHCQQCGEPKRSELGCRNCAALRQLGVHD